MGSIFFHGLRGTCLLATLASAGLWARTYYVSDTYVRPVRNGTSGFAMVASRAVQTAPGQIFYQERTAVM